MPGAAFWRLRRWADAQSPAADPSSAGDSSGAESQEPQEHVTLTYMSRYIDGAPDAMGQFYYERLHQYDEENDNITIEDLSVNELMCTIQAEIQYCRK